MDDTNATHKTIPTDGPAQITRIVLAYTEHMREAPYGGIYNLVDYINHFEDADAVTEWLISVAMIYQQQQHPGGDA